MSKIAVIKTGGKQYKVKAGETLKVEKLDLEPGATVELETLLISDLAAKDLQIGKPTLASKVSAKVVEHGLAKKVSVIKFHSKTRFKKNVGHRQPFTKLEISTF